MNISDIINKSSPIYKQKEMSKSEYKKLVDRNTELIDKFKELEDWLDYEINKSKFEDDYNKADIFKIVLNKLNEIKGSGK